MAVVRCGGHFGKTITESQGGLFEIVDGGAAATSALTVSTTPTQAEAESAMLLNGYNHVAILTNDTERFVAFYREVFDAKVAGAQDMDGHGTLTFVEIGDHSEINLFEVYGNVEAQRQTPMFGRGRIDHLGLEAASVEAFEEIRRRLIALGAADEFVTDFGPVLSLFFTDPDGLEGEVCVVNPDSEPGVFNPPGTPAARYLKS
jgi:catechol 2,3-dioxygenase-like lactoylglutathione lyase family enzyme